MARQRQTDIAWGTQADYRADVRRRLVTYYGATEGEADAWLAANAEAMQHWCARGDDPADFAACYGA